MLSVEYRSNPFSRSYQNPIQWRRSGSTLLYCLMPDSGAPGKRLIMYRILSESIDRVLNNILNSLPRQFTSAQFIKAVSDYCAPQYQEALRQTTYRALHSWIVRWYLTSNSRITKVANGQRQVETINGNKSTNALWNNPVKN